MEAIKISWGQVALLYNLTTRMAASKISSTVRCLGTSLVWRARGRLEFIWRSVGSDVTLKKLCHFSESELGIDFVAFTAVMCRTLCVGRAARWAGRTASCRFVNPLLSCTVRSKLLVTLITSESGKTVVGNTAASIRLLVHKICDDLRQKISG